MIAASFACGIASASYFPFHFSYLLFAAAICGVGSIALSGKYYSTVMISAAFLFAGGASFIVEKEAIPKNRIKAIFERSELGSDGPVDIEGVIVGGSEPAFDRHVITLRVDSLSHRGKAETVSGNIRLYLNVQSGPAADDLARLGLQNGSRIRAAAVLDRSERFLNPGVTRSIEILDQQDIDATAFVKSPLLIEKLDDGLRYSPLAVVVAMRNSMIERMRETFSASTTGVLAASLLGDKYFLDRRTAEVFRDGGTFHVLVISGLHITFMGGLAVIVIGLFTRSRTRQFVAASAFLWLFTFAVGAEVPVVRASLMFTMLLLSRAIYRTGSSVNVLAACALILLVWRPHDLFSPSFQLTIASVAAIVGAAFPLIGKLREIGSWIPTQSSPFPPNVPTWLRRACETLYWNDTIWTIESKRQVWSAKLFKEPYFKRFTGWPRRSAGYLVEGILVSIIVQAWLLPFLVVYFHRVALSSVILNLWVGPILAIESFAALFSVLLSLASGTLAAPFVSFTEILNWLLVAVPSSFLNNFGRSIRLPAYIGAPSSIYALYLVPVLLLSYAAMAWQPFGIAKRKLAVPACVFFFASAIALAAVIVLHPFTAPLPNGRLTVSFLDVGQGDAAFVVFPNGETMLVDGGGNLRFWDEKEDGEAIDLEPDLPRVGEMVVSEFLWEKGYSRIDRLVATHADADHIQGLSDVASNFSIGSVLAGQHPDGDPEFAELENVIKRRGIAKLLIGVGDKFVIGGAMVEVLHPKKTSPAVSDNNSSVVLKITFGARSFLLTGDIETEAEGELMTNPGLFAVDVVKVPHHGSKTSSTAAFVAATDPKYAVISVGRRSRFGHPQREVVERWQANGAKVLKTGDRGTITISTDGNDLRVTQYLDEVTANGAKSP